MVESRYQSIFITNADYERTLDRFLLSKNLKSFYQTQKGLLQFSLNNFPDVKLQLSPKGKLNIYHNSLSDLHEIITVLEWLLVSEVENPAQFKLSKIVPSREELMERLMDEPYNPVRALNIKFLAPLIEKGWIVEE